MPKARASNVILGLILVLAGLVQLPELKFLLPDFVIEDEMIAVQGFYQMSSLEFKGAALFKYPGLITLAPALIIYPAGLAANIRTLIHLQTFADFKTLLAHPALSEAGIFYLARLSSLLAGLLAVYLFFVLFRGRFGPRPALLGSLLLAASPAWLFSSSVFKNDSFLLCGLLLTLIASFRMLEQGRAQDYALGGLGLGLCLAAKLHFFALAPLICARLLRPGSRPQKRMLLTLALGLLVFFLLSPFQFLHPLKTSYGLALEMAIQARVHPLLKASSLLWYQRPLLFQLLCVFPLAFGIIAYLIALPGFPLLRKSLDKNGFLLFLSYPLAFFFGFSLISKLGYPHLYLPLAPFFAAAAGLALDRMLRGKILLKVAAAVLLLAAVLSNVLGFRDFNRAQSSIVYQGLDYARRATPRGENAAAFFPYRPLAGSSYQIYFSFTPQFMLTREWLAHHHPRQILVHQTAYLAYLDNPEIQSPDREGFFWLRQGKAGYRLEREWRAQSNFTAIYGRLFPDLANLSVGFYRRQ